MLGLIQSGATIHLYLYKCTYMCVQIYNNMRRKHNPNNGNEYL